MTVTTAAIAPMIAMMVIVSCPADTRRYQTLEPA
jgi:hypothetical protein